MVAPHNNQDLNTDSDAFIDVQFELLRVIARGNRLFATHSVLDRRFFIRYGETTPVWLNYEVADPLLHNGYTTTTPMSRKVSFDTISMF